MVKVIKKIFLFCLIVNFTVGCTNPKLEKQNITTTVSMKHNFSEIRTSMYHPDKAIGSDNMYIDTSCANEGYVAVSAASNNKLIFQVIKEKEIYNYNIENNSNPSIIPLQCGNGIYTFRVMENVYEKKYKTAYELTEEVKLINEFEPFLHPNDYIQFNKNSECVKVANKLAENTESDIEIIENVYKYICDNIEYDTEKAKIIKKIYNPDLDEILTNKKGICFDYASLAAGMLRSQGIPTKLVMGYLEPDDLYHAWNMVYTKENGWELFDFTDKTNENNILLKSEKVYKELYEY